MKKSLGQIGYESLRLKRKWMPTWEEQTPRTREESELFARTVKRETLRRQKKKKP